MKLINHTVAIFIFKCWQNSYKVIQLSHSIFTFFRGRVDQEKKKKKVFQLGSGLTSRSFSAHRRPWLILTGWTHFLPLLAANFSLHFEALTHVWDFRILGARLHPPQRQRMNHMPPLRPLLSAWRRQKHFV